MKSTPEICFFFVFVFFVLIVQNVYLGVFIFVSFNNDDSNNDNNNSNNNNNKHQELQ